MVRTSQAATQGRWVMYELGTFGKDYSNAVAINDRGQVVCNAWVGDEGPIEVSPPRVNHAFLWENGKSTKLTLGGKETGIGYDYIGGGHDEAINERGQVVGWTNTKSGATHAFLWQNGKMTDLGTLGGKESAAPASGPVAINDSGQVVGGAETKSGATHPFFWENGKMTRPRQGRSRRYQQPRPGRPSSPHQGEEQVMAVRSTAVSLAEREDARCLERYGRADKLCQCDQRSWPGRRSVPKRGERQ